MEAADPAVVNQDFEARTFGHRALIHAHITEGRKRWGSCYDRLGKQAKSSLFLPGHLPSYNGASEVESRRGIT